MCFGLCIKLLNFCDITKQERIPPGEAFPSDWVGQDYYGMGSSRSTIVTIGQPLCLYLFP